MTSSVDKWAAAGQRFAMLHNHPESGPPSMADVRALRGRGAEFGVVACHDGTVYRYLVVGEPAAGYTLGDEGMFRYMALKGRRAASEAEIFENVERIWGSGLSILLDAYNASRTYELVNPESSPLVEVIGGLAEADGDLAADEYLRLFELCRDEGHDVRDESFEKFEPVIVREFTARRGRA